jgi:hypothetical protein
MTSYASTTGSDEANGAGRLMKINARLGEKRGIEAQRHGTSLALPGSKIYIAP